VDAAGMVDLFSRVNLTDVRDTTTATSDGDGDGDDDDDGSSGFQANKKITPPHETRRRIKRR